jgi:hypothetical protein
MNMEMGSGKWENLPRRRKWEINYGSEYCIDLLQNCMGVESVESMLKTVNKNKAIL